MREYRRRHIRALAERLLEEYDALSRPVDVEHIAVSLGISVRRSATEDEISGFLYRDPDGNTIVGVNAAHHQNRQRFTIAHEIGHLLMHVRSGIHIDSIRSSPQVHLRSELSSEGTDPEEVEANVFASELLMPASLFAQDLEAIGPLDLTDEETLDDEFVRLAGLYQVSKQAIVFRVARLGYANL